MIRDVPHKIIWLTLLDYIYKQPNMGITEFWNLLDNSEKLVDVFSAHRTT